MGHLVVLSGPPLPGRWSLARRLQGRLGARRLAADSAAVELGRAVVAPGWLLVDGDLPRASERRALLGRAAAVAPLLVEWRCERAEAERAIFHRYASRPGCLAEAELRRYEEDAQEREPADDSELPRRARRVAIDAALPLEEQLAAVLAALPVAVAPPGAAAETRRRVMVVEDDDDERALLAEVLAELGFAVEPAPDAGVALALLDEGVQVDLMISDQRMPGMTGIELTRTLAQRHPEVRTVLLTAYGDPETCQAALEASVVSVLAKPLRVVDLQRVLDEAAASRV
jgi:CheY-like chemotaxis protein